MKTINLSNEDLDAIDLSEFDKYLNEKYKYTYKRGGYGFYDKSGVEQYKLLAYMSTLLDNETILDVGTFEGGSALALSKNKTNNVVSIDINYQVNQDIDLDNILFLEGDILNHDEEIIKIESNFRGRTLDKNYGKELIDKSNELIEKIEKMGGMTVAVINGFPKSEIEISATKRQAKIDSGEQVIAVSYTHLTLPTNREV